MAEEVQVVLRKSENFTYGFSLLGTAGLPHVIYDILENSPAAECGEVEAGDVIVKVNGTDVHRYTTKEVLKCLRLSQDPVTLDLKRDPKIKAKVRHYLAQTHSASGYTEFPDCDLNASIRLSPTPSPTPPAVVYSASQRSLQAPRIHSTKSIASNSNNFGPPTSGAGAGCPSPTNTTQCRKSRIPTIIRSPVQQPHNAQQHQSAINHSNSSPNSGSTAAATSHITSPRSIRAPSASILAKSETRKSPPPSQQQQSPIPMTNAQHYQHLNGSSQTTNNHHQQKQQQQQQQHHYNNGSASKTSTSSTIEQYNHCSGNSQTTTSTTTTSTTKKQRFEAYMMTGDLILNLSRTEQSSGLIGQSHHAKKVDSLRDSPKAQRNNGGGTAAGTRIVSSRHHQQYNGGGANAAAGGFAPHAKGESSLSSPSFSDDETSGSVNSIKRHQQQQQQQQPASADDVDCHARLMHNSNSSSGSGAAAHNNMNICNSAAGNGDTSNPYTISTTNNGSASAASANANGSALARCRLDGQGSVGGSGGGGAGYDGGDDYCCDGDDEDQSVGSSTAARSDNLGSPDAINCFSVPTSPTSLSAPVEAVGGAAGAISAPSSPAESMQQQHAAAAAAQQSKQQDVVYRRAHNGAAGGSGAAGGGHGSGTAAAGVNRRNDAAGFRTSRSEDHLQHTQRDILGAAIPIDIDEDVNSSLNTLLDTRQDSEDSQSSASDRDRIVWTYNAPVTAGDVQQMQQLQQQQQQHHHHQQQPTHQHPSHSSSHSSSISSSPQRSDSPLASPTSVSSSVMSSNSGSRIAAHAAAAAAAGNGSGTGNGGHQGSSSSTGNTLSGGDGGSCSATGAGAGPGTAGGIAAGATGYGGAAGSSGGGGGGGNLQSLMGPLNNGDHSVSEAVSNISSPDYQDDDNLLSSKDITGMAISDASDSDSTILVSDAGQQQKQQHRHHFQQQQQQSGQRPGDHKIVIRVRGEQQQQLQHGGYEEFTDGGDDDCAGAGFSDDVPTQMMFGNQDGRESSPPVSDDGSDVDSLHSYHYSPKAVDIPSAVRLAKRLYSLDGFKKSDVSRHLSKNNDFSRAVAEEYLKFFQFSNHTLDEALRQFLQQFALNGETQERERVLVHFSRRYLDCNPRTYNSQDAVHTLTCAIMLLNTDLHGDNIGRKMTCAEFIDNLAELNDGENFPKDVLKSLYQAIKGHRLEWALDDDSPDAKSKEGGAALNAMGAASGGNALRDSILEQSACAADATEYKKGYVMRKCCYDSNNKKTPFGKRSWKMFYCTLRDLVLYLHKDEHGFKRNQMTDNVHNAIRIHHALASKASDYTKKQHVFRLQTADQSEYLFQTSDSKELQSWIDTVNFVCAAYSAPPLEGAVGSQKRFQRPLLPSSQTKLLIRQQLANHEEKVAQLEASLSEHRSSPTPSKGLPLQNHREKDAYLQFEYTRYRTYVHVLGARVFMDDEEEAAAAAAAAAGGAGAVGGPTARYVDSLMERAMAAAGSGNVASAAAAAAGLTENMGAIGDAESGAGSGMDNLGQLLSQPTGNRTNNRPTTTALSGLTTAGPKLKGQPNQIPTNRSVLMSLLCEDELGEQSRQTRPSNDTIIDYLAGSGAAMNINTGRFEFREVDNEEEQEEEEGVLGEGDDMEDVDADEEDEEEEREYHDHDESEGAKMIGVRKTRTKTRKKKMTSIFKM